MTLHALFPDKNSMAEYTTYYVATIKKKISESAHKYVPVSDLPDVFSDILLLRYDGVLGTYIDIVKGVIYPTVAHVAADRFVSEKTCHTVVILNRRFKIGTTLKSKDNPNGLFTELEMFEMLEILVNGLASTLSGP